MLQFLVFGGFPRSRSRILITHSKRLSSTVFYLMKILNFCHMFKIIIYYPFLGQSILSFYKIINAWLIDCLTQMNEVINQ